MDGFQGREKEAVVITLVRSNTKGISEVRFQNETESKLQVKLAFCQRIGG